MMIIRFEGVGGRNAYMAYGYVRGDLSRVRTRVRVGVRTRVRVRV